MGVPPVLSERAGRPSHKNHQIVSYLILIPNRREAWCAMPDAQRPKSGHLVRKYPQIRFEIEELGMTFAIRVWSASLQLHFFETAITYDGQ